MGIVIHTYNALYQQAQQLEHVIFTGFTHEPAEQVRKLLDSCQNLTRVFFSDNRSTAVGVCSEDGLPILVLKHNAPPLLALKVDITEIRWEPCQ